MKQKVLATDIFDLIAVSQPVATSTAVFYLTTQMRAQQDDYATTIMRLDRETRLTTQWGTLSGQDKQLALTDDQQWVTFTSLDAHQVRQVYRQSLSGGSPEQVTVAETSVLSYVTNADATIVYYQVDRPLMDNIDDDRPKLVTYTHATYKDNHLGYFAENVSHEIFAQIVGNDDAQSVYQNTERFTLGPLSHDGALLAFSTAGQPKEETDFSVATWTLKIATGERTRVTASTATAALTPVAFSADDSRLLVVGSTNAIPNVTAPHLYCYDVLQRSLTDLTPNRDVIVGDAVLSADAQQNLRGQAAAFIDNDTVVYQQLTEGTMRLMTVDLTTQKSQVLVDGQQHITDFMVTPDGQQVIYTKSSWLNVAAIEAVQIETRAVTPVSNPNEAYEEAHALVDPTRFTFKGEADVVVHGWYLPPVDTKQLTQYPVMLYIHGGPGANYGESFFHELQVYASAGYGVIAINPRGSTSYGEDFRHAVIGHYGQGDYTDLMDGLDYVLSQDPKIDQNHQYVTGGSYGGYMTNWIEGHTDRFKAAVTQRSIANWISMFGTSDIGYSFLPWELTGNQTMSVTDTTPLWDASPLKFVQNVKTPTLVLHSERDFRCPIGQGEEWFTSLRLNGVEAKMVRFPGENHGLSRNGKPSLRVERIRQIQDWFTTHC
ncbi:S9 family peptidase [Furfurilactobacillus siliginis]|uniref:Peptidase S9 n=1 Tax=Furfurilactobacillus siliginis TaxID=348151 RepID=A0A0R2KXT2_9LACO|nr:S9 family peptidase [Furfurilactobacillus siliginis]KRN94096.1 S9C subfamily peptidase [Furfurilactobacillus siliginis]GEK29474.1 peptidase S9 [Furfurilactobacillus siliginis]